MIFNINSTRGHTGSLLVYDYMGQQCPNSMFINQVSEDEVVNIIKSCKPKHSKDCDDITMYVLTNATDQIVKPLVHM